MFNVAYKITIGAISLQSGKSSRLVALESSASLDVPVNSCRIVLEGQSRLSAAAGDPVKVELGYNNNLPIIFTGKLESIECRLDQICVEARGAFAGLVTAYQSRVYEQQNASAIVSDLLSTQQIAQSTLETGAMIERFVVSDRQTVWAAIHDLGRRCGCDFYADCEDRAVFKRYAPQKTYLFTYGGDILEYLAEPTTDAHIPSTHTSENIVQAGLMQACGRLRALGAPVVQLCDAIQISRMPDSVQDGTFKITGVRHQLSHSVGFITDIFWKKV